MSAEVPFRVRVLRPTWHEFTVSAVTQEEAMRKALLMAAAHADGCGALAAEIIRGDGDAFAEVGEGAGGEGG